MHYQMQQNMLETKGAQTLFKNLFKNEIDNIANKGILKKHI